MNTKNFRQRIAFSIVELLIAITILGIMAAYITMNANSTSQTAKAEAEKVAELFRRYITRADKFHGGFSATIEERNIKIGEENFPASAGCKYEGDDFTYNVDRNSTIMTRNVEILLVSSENEEYPYNIKITDSKGKNYWVVLSYDNSL